MTDLTPREHQVLIALAQMSTKQAAHSLGISVKTVETHRVNIYAKLGINNIVDLVRYVIRVGLIEA